MLESTVNIPVVSQPPEVVVEQGRGPTAASGHRDHSVQAMSTLPVLGHARTM